VKKIAIINYGVGNHNSIKNMLRKAGSDGIITSDPKEIEAAEKLIFPGVGSFDSGMTALENSGLLELLNYKALVEKAPILGICLGMQLMTSKSDEGGKKGLSWVNATTEKFSFSNESVNVPHMGWNTIIPQKPSSLLTGLINSRFYFIHSYYVKCLEKQDVMCLTHYEKPFTSAFEKDNLIGVQFHPEKSHVFGKAILKNFVENY
jgi:glutamine amidotransferase